MNSHTTCVNINADSVPKAIAIRILKHFFYRTRGTVECNRLPCAEKFVTGIQQSLERFFAISHVRYTPGDEDTKKWQALLSKYSPGEQLQIFQVLGLGSAKVVVEVLRRVGRDLTRARFKEEMQKLTGFETGILPGPITCTETDHQCHKTPAWVSLVDDKVVTVDTTTVKK